MESERGGEDEGGKGGNSSSTPARGWRDRWIDESGSWQCSTAHWSTSSNVSSPRQSHAVIGREGAGSSRMNSTPFQLARMDHFFHELEAFDQLAIYDPPALTYEDSMTSSTSDTGLSVTCTYDPPAPTY